MESLPPRKERRQTQASINYQLGAAIKNAFDAGFLTLEDLRQILSEGPSVIKKILSSRNGSYEQFPSKLLLTSIVSEYEKRSPQHEDLKIALTEWVSRLDSNSTKERIAGEETRNTLRPNLILNIPIQPDRLRPPPTFFSTDDNKDYVATWNLNHLLIFDLASAQSPIADFDFSGFAVPDQPVYRKIENREILIVGRHANSVLYIDLHAGKKVRSSFPVEEITSPVTVHTLLDGRTVISFKSPGFTKADDSVWIFQMDGKLLFKGSYLATTPAHATSFFQSQKDSEDFFLPRTRFFNVYRGSKIAEKNRSRLRAILYEKPHLTDFEDKYIKNRPTLFCDSIKNNVFAVFKVPNHLEFVNLSDRNSEKLSFECLNLFSAETNHFLTQKKQDLLIARTSDGTKIFNFTNKTFLEFPFSNRAAQQPATAFHSSFGTDILALAAVTLETGPNSHVFFFDLDHLNNPLAQLNLQTRFELRNQQVFAGRAGQGYLGIITGENRFQVFTLLEASHRARILPK